MKRVSLIGKLQNWLSAHPPRRFLCLQSYKYTHDEFIWNTLFYFFVSVLLLVILYDLNISSELS